MGRWRSPAPANTSELQYRIHQLERRIPVNLWLECDEDDDDIPEEAADLQRQMQLDEERRMWQQGKK